MNISIKKARIEAACQRVGLLSFRSRLDPAKLPKLDEALSSVEAGSE
jgi:hypothetical protein